MAETQDRGRKILEKSAGMMETFVISTVEETWYDDDNGGGRDAVLWGRQTRKSGGDCGGKFSSVAVGKWRHPQWRDNKVGTAAAEMWGGEKIDTRQWIWRFFTSMMVYMNCNKDMQRYRCGNN